MQKLVNNLIKTTENRLFELNNTLKSEVDTLRLENKNLFQENLDLQKNGSGSSQGGAYPHDKIRLLEEQLLKSKDDLIALQKQLVEQAQQVILLNKQLKDKNDELSQKEVK